MRILLTSDHHFGHANFLGFKDDEGEYIRRFEDVNAMDEYMIGAWNSVVAPGDKVYHLGDVCFNLQTYHRVMPQLNGTKVLILGNHDKFKMHQYQMYFKDIYGWRIMDTNPKIVCTHVPVHPMGLGCGLQCNAHGHTHEKTVPGDTRYYNVCVERTGYAPIELDQVVEELKLYAS